MLLLVHVRQSETWSAHHHPRTFEVPRWSYEGQLCERRCHLYQVIGQLDVLRKYHRSLDLQRFSHYDVYTRRCAALPDEMTAYAGVADARPNISRPSNIEQSRSQSAHSCTAILVDDVEAEVVSAGNLNISQRYGWWKKGNVPVNGSLSRQIFAGGFSRCCKYFPRSAKRDACQSFDERMKVNDVSLRAAISGRQ
ncbi:hypothetical protein BDW22DRAFT_1225406 [Trametopsis cervina]|nr:hypothetical protein BDW22DRAFT_1225406 [Trametopsis cervina]